MENKYYTPSIEEIRVGYECETTTDGENWKPEIFNGIVKTWYMPYVRTPYLTKEQIEAEGWEYNTNTLFENENGDDIFAPGWEKSISESEWYALKYNGLTQDLLIQRRWYRNQVTQLWENLFKGKSPSINELRYISKLLGI